MVMLTHVTCIPVTPGNMRIHWVTGGQSGPVSTQFRYSLMAKMSSRKPH
jgi:hypothetical protein